MILDTLIYAALIAAGAAVLLAADMPYYKVLWTGLRSKPLDAMLVPVLIAALPGPCWLGLSLVVVTRPVDGQLLGLLLATEATILVLKMYTSNLRHFFAAGLAGVLYASGALLVGGVLS